MKSIFPEEMLNTSGGELSLEMIASRLSYFFEQVHLFHLQTPSHAQHEALNLWKDIVDAKDSFLEQAMGYEGRKVKAYKFEPIVDYCSGAPEKVVLELKNFAKQLENYASIKGYSNIENMAQELNGKSAKVLYLLTQT
jgi:hypothetical protein